MGRKKHAEEHENLERWLVSYADFITLLFALFVVLYALSQIDLAKYKDFSVSVKKAFSHSPSVLKGDAGVLSSQGNNVMDSGGMDENQNIVPPIMDQVASEKESEEFEKMITDMKLEQIDKVNGVVTKVTERGLVINLLGNVFFEQSASHLREGSYEVLNRIGNLLKKRFSYNLIRVEGHSDSNPIVTEQYPSNWELSAARAATIVRYFINTHGFEKDKFTVVGYADSRPIATNETEEGRRANRRVEIVVLRSRFLRSEEQTYEFQKARLERLKRIEGFYKNKTEEKDAPISDAAKKLINDSNSHGTKIILYSDEYSEESGELLKELESREEKSSSKVKKRKFLKSVRDELNKE